ncbi:sensor histidine kinase [Phytomonospora sp. NPDC050363]|uniref:sensor histidine kinase n=1 Tax=Phytomonospora sp. NPDC050363 TaxID=3155642 RepID=UPI0033F47DB0
MGKISSSRSDLGLAVVVGSAQVTDMLLAGGPIPPLTFVLAGVATVAVLFLHRFPRVVMLVALATLMAYGTIEPPSMIQAIPLLFAVYAVIDAGHWKPVLAIVAPVLLLTTVAGVLTDDGTSLREHLQEAGLPLGWFVAAAVLGQVSRQRRAYVQAVEQRAAEAERTKEEAALRRAGEERLRIARDLHDSLTHSISVIKVQAGVAVHLARKRGEEVPTALAAIQEASTVATRELRETLDVLRDRRPGSEVGGLAGLPALVARASSAGIAASLETAGTERAVPAEVGQTAYRIVQEALTNVARHAGPATARVQLAYAADRLDVRVTDDGPAVVASPPTPGVGLTGMRERVTALGGTLKAAPAEAGGFAVHAVLPLGAV